MARPPRAQLIPTRERLGVARRCCRRPRSSGPESVRPEASVIVTEIITGTRGAPSSKTDLDGEERGLGVERVEDRLDQQGVDARAQERAGLLGVGGDHLVPGDGAVVGSVHVGRHGERPVERPDRSGDEAAAARRRRFRRPGGPAGHGDRGAIEFGDDWLEAIVGLGDRRGIEGVGLDQVRPGVEIGAVDLFDEVGAREAEQIVVALQVVGMGAQAFAAKVRLLQAEGLDHRAHRAIQDGDALGEERAEGGEGRRFLGGRVHVWVGRHKPVEEKGKTRRGL